MICLNGFLYLHTVVHCPRETGVLNTQDFNQEFPYGETRSASCKGGFETAGSLDVTCQSNGNWSTPTGYCRSKLVQHIFRYILTEKSYLNIIYHYINCCLYKSISVNK